MYSSQIYKYPNRNQNIWFTLPRPNPFAGRNLQFLCWAEFAIPPSLPSPCSDTCRE